MILLLYLKVRALAHFILLIYTIIRTLFGFSRRYIGIKISMPIPMYGVSNLSIIYIGMGQYRLFPMYRQKSPKQNTSNFDHLWQSRCIKILHTSETQVFFQSRCIPINFPRIYLQLLEVYSRASQPQFNFPRLYSLSYQKTDHSSSDSITWSM